MAVLACIFSVLGCEENVTAVLGTDRPFSLFGVVSPQLDSQWVRAFPVEDILEPESGERLDAHFVSADLENGEEHVWRDSVILDTFNQRAHVFWAPFRAEYAHRYRLVVRRSNGHESHVEVTVPPRTQVVLHPPAVSSFSVTLPVLIEGDAPRVLRIEVVYSVGFQRAGSVQPEGDDVSISYDGAQQETADGWLIPILPSRDFDTIAAVLIRRIEAPIDRDVGLTLLSLTLRLIVGNAEWDPPDGSFDPERLVQPETMTNVQNGFGFVGAGYRHEKVWLPAAEVIEAAGFRVQQE
jgi:hypothetical protein